MKVRVVVLLLFISSVLCFSQDQDDWFMGKPIRDIVFTGLRNIAASELEALMQPYIDRIFDEVIFWEIQGKLYALEYFDRIEPNTIRANNEGSEVIISFRVIERPTIGRIVFSGNAGIRNRELQDITSSRVNDIYNQAKVRVDIEAIRNLYVEKGYPNVVINAEENPASDGRITLVFRIIERERISISRIEFQGNSRFSNNALRSQLSLKAKSLINDGAFQEAKLLADIEAINKYYHDRGFIDASVRDVTRTYNTEGNITNLTLTFMIEEGSEFRFGGVTFQGNEIFSNDQLSKLISSKVGDIVNASKLELDLQNVSDLYFENGYIFNSIIRTPEKNYQTLVLSYTITIVERNRAYVENIIIIGNEKTKTEVILREIPLEPGDVFSRTKVMDAMRNLYNLQYFSMVIPDTLPGSTENLMDLVFTVEEQMTTDIQFGLTFSGSSDPEAFPISGIFSLKDRNVSGTGNELGIDLRSSIVDSSKIELNYLQRWILGLPLSLGMDFTADFTKRLATMRNQTFWFYGDEEGIAFPDGFSSYEEYADNDKLPPSEFLMKYDQWYLSLGFSSGYRWYKPIGIVGVNGGMRFGIVRNSYDKIFEPFDPALRERNNQWTPMNSFWFSGSLDQRDIFYDPTRGFYLFNRFGFYGIFPDEREYFVRDDIKAQYFLTLFNIPITDKWSFRSVFAINLGLSFIARQPGRGSGPDNKLPRIEEANKLAVDGMFVGRGWSDVYRDKGLLLVDTWAELRFPIVRGILAFDLFFDGAGVETEQGFYFGKNSSGSSNFKIENMRFSFGGGLRLTLAQFPIRLSLAKRFKVNGDGGVEWQTGSLFGKEEGKGLDLVISFVMAY